MNSFNSYSRLPLISYDELDCTEDNLRNGTDCSNFVNAVRVGYLMSQIFHQRISMFRNNRIGRSEQEVAVAIGPSTSRPPCKLSKVWKRFKRAVFRRDRCVTNEEVLENKKQVPALGDITTTATTMPLQGSKETTMSPRYSSLDRELDLGGPTYSSIVMGDSIQELQMKQKVIAWVENLDNPNTRDFYAALMVAPDKRFS